MNPAENFSQLHLDVTTIMACQAIPQIAGPPTQMPSKERFRSRGPVAIKSIKTNVKDIAEGN